MESNDSNVKMMMVAAKGQLCLVCNTGAGNSSVSVHATLPSKGGTVHARLVDLVGKQHLVQACQTSQVLCGSCLGQLLNIVYLECRVVVLRDEFCTTFHKGANARRIDSKECQSKENEIYQETNNATSIILSDAFTISKTMEKAILTKQWASEQKLSYDGVNSILRIPWTNSEHKLSSDGMSVKPQSISKPQSFPSGQEVSDSLPQHSTMDSHTLQFHTQKDNNESQAKWSNASSKSNVTNAVEIQSTVMEHVEKREVKCVKNSDEERNETGVDVTTGEEVESICVIPDLDDMSLSDETPILHFNPEEEGASFAVQPKKSKPTVYRRKKTGRKKILKKKAADSAGQDKQQSGRGRHELQCTICSVMFSEPEQLGLHRGQAHPKDYPYSCPTCPNAHYREKAKLTQHLRHSHSLAAHPCPACDYKAGSQNSLDQHIIQQHPSSRFYKCHICQKAFRTHRYLHFVHIKRCHVGLPIKYSCDKCGKGFVDKSSFENHKVTHSVTRNFTCEVCGAAFRTLYALKVHVNTHTKEKVYTCGDCGDTFLRMGNLSSHRRRYHSGREQFVCEVCGLSRPTRRNLHRHQLSAHSQSAQSRAEGKRFSCHSCERSYATRYSLKYHIQTHHMAGKPHNCECGKAFYYRDSLRRHQRQIHNGEFSLGPCLTQEPKDSQPQVLMQQIISNQSINPQVLQALATTEAASVSETPVEVVDEDLGGGHMVVITLCECTGNPQQVTDCNPMALYSMPDTPCLEEVVVATSDGSPRQSHIIANNAPDTLHLDAHSTNHITLSSPLLLTTPSTFTTTITTPSFITHPTTILSDCTSTAQSTLTTFTTAITTSTHSQPSFISHSSPTFSDSTTLTTLTATPPTTASHFVHLPSVHAAIPTISFTPSCPSSL